MTERFAVLGAGALGLTLGMRLAERGHNVVVFEREPMPGGLAAGFPLGNSHLEKFYHHLFKTDHRAIALINELGLGDRLIWTKPVTAVLKNGTLWRIDSPRAVVEFNPLPLASRLRMGVSLAYLKAVRSGTRFEGKTAASWIQRWMGEPAYSALWEPLLMSKFGDRREDIAMPWFWARVHYRTAALGYLRGGFQQLYNSLMHRIVGLGSEVRLSVPVREITLQPGGLVVATEVSEERFDSVISTLPVHATANLVPGLPPRYRDTYGAVEGYGAICLILSLARPLTDAYWINLNDPGFPFQPFVEHTNLMPSCDYGDRHITYLGNYLPRGHRVFDLDKEELLDEFLPGIRLLNPRFEKSWVTESWVYKAPIAQPIVTIKYASRIPPHVTPIPGLFLANMFQVYPQDRGQNYSIALAEGLVREVL